MLLVFRHILFCVGVSKLVLNAKMNCCGGIGFVTRNLGKFTGCSGRWETQTDGFDFGLCVATLCIEMKISVPVS